MVRKHGPCFRAVLDSRVHIGAFVDQQLDEVEVIHVALAHRVIAVFDVAVVRGKVQRSPPAFVRETGIRTMIEKIRTKLVVPVLSGHQQWAPAVTGGLIDVDTGCEENLHRFDIIRTCGVDQRRQFPAINRRRTAEETRRNGGIVLGIRRRLIHSCAARCRCRSRLRARAFTDLTYLIQVQGLSGGEGRALRRDLPSRIVRFAERRSSSTRCGIRARIDIGSMLNQKLHGGGMRFVCSPHERTRAAQRFFRVDIRAVVNQNLDRIDIPGARRRHHRSAAQRQMLVGIGSGVEQCADDCGISVDARQPQRRRAFAVRHFRIRARANQHVHQFLVAAIRRPVKRRRPVRLRHIDVGVLFDERTNCRFVAPRGSIRNVAADCSRTGDRHEQQGDANSSYAFESHHKFSNRPVLSPMLSW